MVGINSDESDIDIPMDIVSKHESKKRRKKHSSKKKKKRHRRSSSSSSSSSKSSDSSGDSSSSNSSRNKHDKRSSVPQILCVSFRTDSLICNFIHCYVIFKFYFL